MNSMLVPAPAIITLKENKIFDWLKLTELMKMTESEHASGFHSHENFYMQRLLILFCHIVSTIHTPCRYFFIDIKSSKRHVPLLTLVFLIILETIQFIHAEMRTKRFSIAFI